jgi:hypothetical protein
MVTFLAVSFSAASHSINFETTLKSPVVIIKAYFTRTTPLADASVVIFAPGDDRPYQSVNTNRQGYFVFLPDAAGTWVFVINDERGHRGRLVVEIDKEFFNGEQETVTGSENERGEVITDNDLDLKTAEHSADIPVFYRVLFGIALIFGITGVFYGVRAKQAAKKNV